MFKGIRFFTNTAKKHLQFTSFHTSTMPKSFHTISAINVFPTNHALVLRNIR